ncbi:MAG: translation initiation factor, partial [Planctomycetota bacterium]
MSRLFAGTQWDVPPTCDRCDATLDACECPPESPGKPSIPPPEKQRARVRLEKRKGKKLITVIAGLFNDREFLSGVLSKLQSGLGTGGSVQADQIELQGDHVQRAGDVLT